MPRASVLLGNRSFPTKKAATDYIRSAINALPFRVSIRQHKPELFAELVDLVTHHHPRGHEKLAGLERMEIQNDRGGRKIVLVYYDGKPNDDVSWVKCITGERSADAELMRALRCVVNDDIMEYRRGVFAQRTLTGMEFRCEMCGSEVVDWHADHIDKFRHIVNSFHRTVCDAENLTIPKQFDRHSRPDVGGHLDFLPEDAAYRQRWVEYHRENLRLRVLCIPCNAREG